MTLPTTEEKLRKLASVSPKETDLAWLFYLSSEGKDRQEADELFDILLHQKVQKDYREKIILDPPNPLDCSGTYQRLLTSNVILELDALSDSDKIFLTEAIILWVYEFRKNQGKREEFKHALLIEEGHHILSQHKENVEGQETIMETSLRQIREFGEAVIVIDQEPSKISSSIKANTYTKITFNLGNGKDVQEIARCMSLNKEESEYIDLLDVGNAIVSLKGRVKVPLHVTFPKMNLRKGVIQDRDLPSA